VRASAVASEPPAEEAAERTLREGGTCADALVAAFLAAAASRPGVLLSPVQALLAGPGAGARAFDGRARQPGLGLPRPRGFVKGQAIPDAAYVAVPASLAVLALVQAHGGKLSRERVAAPAIELARRLGASERADLLARFSRVGPSALREPGVARPLLAVAGRTEGGLLSELDLAEVRPESTAPRDADLGGVRRVLVTPWPAPEAPERLAEFVAAADGSGVLGALSYAPDDEGVAVPDLGLTLPCHAIAIRRGVPRVAPGEPLPCAAPIAVGLQEHLAFIALGVRSATALSIAEMFASWSDQAATGQQLLAGAKRAARGAMALAVLRSTETQQVQKLSLTDTRS